MMRGIRMRGGWLSGLGLALLIGCTLPPGGSEQAPPASSPVPQLPSQAATEIVVTRDDMRFSPATVTIPAGGTVVWKFEGSLPHSTTSEAGSPKAWDSGILGPGATYAVKFDQPGTYPYYCTPHRSMGMKGVVIVQ